MQKFSAIYINGKKIIRWGKSSRGNKITQNKKTCKLEEIRAD